MVYFHSLFKCLKPHPLLCHYVPINNCFIIVLGWFKPLVREIDTCCNLLHGSWLFRWIMGLVEKVCSFIIVRGMSFTANISTKLTMRILFFSSIEISTISLKTQHGSRFGKKKKTICKEELIDGSKFWNTILRKPSKKLPFLVKNSVWII